MKLYQGVLFSILKSHFSKGTPLSQSLKNYSKQVVFSKISCSILFQIQSDRLLRHQSHTAKDVHSNSVPHSHLGPVSSTLLSADLCHGHEGGAHPSHSDEHGGGLVHCLLCRRVGRVQERQIVLLNLFASGSGKSGIHKFSPIKKIIYCQFKRTMYR